MHWLRQDHRANRKEILTIGTWFIEFCSSLEVDLQYLCYLYIHCICADYIWTDPQISPYLFASFDSSQLGHVELNLDFETADKRFCWPWNRFRLDTFVHCIPWSLHCNFQERNKSLLHSAAASEPPSIFLHQEKKIYLCIFASVIRFLKDTSVIMLVSSWGGMRNWRHGGSPKGGSRSHHFLRCLQLSLLSTSDIVARRW